MSSMKVGKLELYLVTSHYHCRSEHVSKNMAENQARESPRYNSVIRPFTKPNHLTSANVSQSPPSESPGEKHKREHTNNHIQKQTMHTHKNKQCTHTIDINRPRVLHDGIIEEPRTNLTDPAISSKPLPSLSLIFPNSASTRGFLNEVTSKNMGKTGPGQRKTCQPAVPFGSIW